MKQKNKKNFGFTLFELLVSISIIAILTAVAVVSFGGLNKKTRDARRSSDMEKMRMALEGAKQIGNTYPSTANLSTVLVGGSFLQQLPTDPKGVGWTYYYSVGTGNYSYVLCAQMEDVGSTNYSSCGSNTCGSGRNCNYRVLSP